MILCTCPTPKTEDDMACDGCDKPIVCNNCRGTIVCDCIPPEEWLGAVLHANQEKVA
jgi:hypothetical protein